MATHIVRAVASFDEYRVCVYAFTSSASSNAQNMLKSNEYVHFKCSIIICASIQRVYRTLQLIATKVYIEALTQRRRSIERWT